jgi:mannose-1-phosphate guanylyltransferase/mannose-6-phosphate isomerase
MKSQGAIFPILLSGGTGSRLWPISREAMPKQFQALAGNESLIRQSAQRMSGPRFAPITVIANIEHRFLVAEQLQAAGVAKPRIVLEPVGRNTAPAAAIAALLALQDDPEAIILLAPADHVITDSIAFLAAVDRAARAARAGFLTLFGIKPEGPATSYGYIRCGEALAEHTGAFRVAAFVEKPDANDAHALLKAGNAFWNSGIFLLPAAGFVEEVARLEPALLSACRAALSDAVEDLDFLRLGSSFQSAPSISIDNAIMERTRSAAVLPASFGWTDVGSWSALWQISERDPAGNAAIGDVILHDATDCYVRSEGPLIAAIGVKDLIVIAAEGAVLVVPKDRDQEVKTIVERLKRCGHAAAPTRAGGPATGLLALAAPPPAALRLRPTHGPIFVQRHASTGCPLRNYQPNWHEVFPGAGGGGPYGKASHLD